MLWSRREACSAKLALICCLSLLCLHPSWAGAADWLPRWIANPVSRLLQEAPEDLPTFLTATEGRQLSEENYKCTDKSPKPPVCSTAELHMQPYFKRTRKGAAQCAYPACPFKAWEVYCDPNCNNEDECLKHRQCFGEEVETLDCPNNPACPNSKLKQSCTNKIDCQFSEWNDWAVEGCTGLCNRTRTLQPNACGGRPCVGRLHETKWCMSPCNPTVDCAFGAWEPWGISDTQNMRHRFRIIAVASSGDGTPCQGPLMILDSCSTAKEKKDCQLSDWMSWSGCTASCGHGQQTQVRGIKQKAEYGGNACPYSELMRSRSCGTDKCKTTSPPQDCKLTAWSAWSGCNTATTAEERRLGSTQQSRSRQVDPSSPGEYGGAVCKGVIHEVEACKAVAAIDCQMSDWSEWDECSKTCDKGQKNRHRNITVSPSRGGAGCEDTLRETMVCNSRSCAGDGGSGNCEWSSWGAWSGCTRTCGKGGQERRHREVVKEAAQGGEGCADTVAQLRACPDREECQKQDCKWADWTPWSACSTTCGISGSRSRSRTVEQEPLNGGEACSSLDSTHETEACKNLECPKNDCVDGVWGAWKTWSTCTRTCGGGAQFRSRAIETKNNHCGKPVNGTSSAFNACSTNACPGDKDCQLSTWTTWSTCSKSCAGSQERVRKITVESVGAGRSCEGALKSMRSCDTLSPKECGHEQIDCVMTNWKQWSTCSRTCGHGQKQRTRDVTTPARNGGKPCEDDLAQITGCDLKLAKCVGNGSQACVWNPWSPWASCTCDGEKLRTRKIAVMPLHADECKAGAYEEISKCQPNPNCGKMLEYCVWGEYEEAEGCSATCGNATRKMRRKMSRTQMMPADASQIIGYLHNQWDKCSGTQERLEDCNDLESCGECTVGKDVCQFSTWSEWEQPKGDDCNKLCKRSRKVTVDVNACDKNCPDPPTLAQTKTCLNAACVPQDCSFGEWSAWNSSSCDGSKGQKTRTRAVKKSAKNNGESCSGALKQTMTCDPAYQEPSDCVWEDWGAWTECSATCDEGYRNSSRDVLYPAAHGGQPCEGPKRRIKNCVEESCKSLGVDCKFSDWSGWYGCDNRPGSQAMRTRYITIYAQGMGKPCRGTTKETEPCPLHPENCELNDWEDWGTCDKSCGGGQKFRTRHLARHASNGGNVSACYHKSIHDTTKCNMEPCKVKQADCALESWSSWSKCNPSCGQGLRTRHRGIKRPPSAGGLGCTEDLSQVDGCKNPTCPGVQDCEITDWLEWGPCNAAVGCGIGYRERERKVAKAPDPLGQPCKPEELKQAKPDESCPGGCNERPFHENGTWNAQCINATWSTWEPWSPCSVTCGKDGMKWRKRNQTKVSFCGYPAEGVTEEYAGCNAPKANAVCTMQVDCAWSPWSQWEACSATCNGNRKKSRTVATHASNGGKPCHGGSVVFGRCNPTPEEQQPPNCPLPPGEDRCAFQDWSSWSKCTMPCEGGSQTRTRSFVKFVAQTDSDYSNATECSNSLEEVTTCNKQTCKADDYSNCEFNAWEKWSDCNSSEQQERSRSIKTPAVHGKDCDGPQREIRGCKSGCQVQRHYCLWSDWSAWSSCTTSCGPQGRITRRRVLMASREVAAAR